MAGLRFGTIINVVLQSHKHITTFRTLFTKFHTPPRYDYIWQLVVAMPSLTAPILELVVNEQLKDWLFDGKKSIVVVDINDAFRELIQDRAWLVIKDSHITHITCCVLTMVSLGFGCRIAFSYSISCKGVCLMCDV